MTGSFEKFIEKISRLSERTKPPWSVDLRSFSPRELTWQCPLCKSSLKIDLIEVKCVDLSEFGPQFPAMHGIVFVFELYCSYEHCPYDKIMGIVFYPPDIKAPEYVSDFRTKIIFLG